LTNLVSRQDTPMLRTNGSSGARELYALADLMSLTCLVNTAPVSRITLGYYSFTMRIRFAGLINPIIPIMSMTCSTVDTTGLDP
jgi:hypothetical protein